MERKISSPFTEVFKVYSILSIIFLIGIIGFGLFGFSDFPIVVFLALGVSLFLAFDFWKMKEVEITDEGLIITERFFFTQKSIFVPFEKVENANSKLWWLGNKKRTTVKFTEPTEFGQEIRFISRGFTRFAQTEIIEEINRAVYRTRIDGKIDRAFNQLTS